MNVDWNRIKNGCHGFERMALEFVKEHFPNPSWHKTKETRDGNKDGIAYVFGYQASNDDTEQWWMEAKYSTQKQYLTRYRLDSTIVSAILQGNVKRVIFVTNILVRSKTISDIRTALLESTQCEKVSFCSRYMLEYWLGQKHNRYQEFFDCAQDTSIDLPEKPFIIEEIEFYEKSSNPHAFCEPVFELETDVTYIGHFSLFSPVECSVRLKKSKKSVGIRIYGSHTFHLSIGENTLQFEIQITSKAIKKQICMFEIDGLELFPAQQVRFIQSQNMKYDLPSQMALIDSLEYSLRRFLHSPRFQIHAVNGSNGVGKSSVLLHLANSNAISKSYFFNARFSSSSILNSRLLVDIVFFILFPYLDPDAIDEQYITSLANRQVSADLISLINRKDSFEALLNFFPQCAGEHNLLPTEFHVNKRIIFLDDVEKLDSIATQFLFELLAEMHQKEIPLFCIITSIPSLLRSKQFTFLKERCYVYERTLALELADVGEVLRQRGYNVFPENYLGHFPQTTIIELLTFALYIEDSHSSELRLDEFIAQFRLFQLSDIVELHIKNRFSNAFTILPSCRALCESIYYSYRPYRLHETDDQLRNEIAFLIEQGLIRYDQYHCLVPAQETYRTIFRKSFPKTVKTNVINSPYDDPESLRINLETCYDIAILEQSAYAVMNLWSKNQYHTLVYILQELFENNNMRIEFENRLQNETQFLNLYFIYTYAANQQSYVSTPILHFRRILSRTTESCLCVEKDICLRTNWELAVIDFDNLNYTKALGRVKSIVALLRDMQHQGYIKCSLLDCEKYHEAMTIKSLVEMELIGEQHNGEYDSRLNCSRDHGFLDRHNNTLIRLSLARITHNYCKSMEDLAKGCNYYLTNHSENSKMYLFGQFSYLYFQVIYDNRLDLFDEVLRIHERMKINQYNNHRKRLFAISTFFFYIGNTKRACNYLLKESYMTRELSKRSQAFFYETDALLELSKGKCSAAIKSLERAALLFKHLPNYSCIPLHNIHLLESSANFEMEYEFWKGSDMKPTTYYLDPRITW